ncbi:hypothetical protein [uncultured Draconibacterium sp.]|uniref:hypothetical protein n=1 Tax=uncultured Draconibacterium sp. TaxID=1573823 RepID=UPI002AA91991|nr:hypothetical protein [uncultured Draconibacterium sp.]
MVGKNNKIIELLNPEVFKSHLMLSSVFIAYFENTVDYIIDQPKSFFTNCYDSEKGEITSPDYKTKVLSLDKKNPVNASLLWFKDFNAINEEDIETFAVLRRYRNKLSHELPKILFDEGLETDTYSENLNNLFSLRIKMEKWWILNIEIDFMEIENPEKIEEKDIVSGGETIYRLFMDLLSEDKEKAYYYTNELKKRMK